MSGANTAANAKCKYVVIQGLTSMVVQRHVESDAEAMGQ